MKKNNLWNTFSVGKKVGMTVFLIVNTLTAGSLNFIVSAVMMPMALMTLYKHYEGFDRCTEGLKYIGGFALSAIANALTFGAISWYSTFGDLENVDEMFRDGKNIMYVIAEEIDFED